MAAEAVEAVTGVAEAAEAAEAAEVAEAALGFGGAVAEGASGWGSDGAIEYAGHHAGCGTTAEAGVGDAPAVRRGVDLSWGAARAIGMLATPQRAALLTLFGRASHADRRPKVGPSSQLAIRIDTKSERCISPCIIRYPFRPLLGARQCLRWDAGHFPRGATCRFERSAGFRESLGLVKHPEQPEKNDHRDRYADQPEENTAHGFRSFVRGRDSLET